MKKQIHILLALLLILTLSVMLFACKNDVVTYEPDASMSSWLSNIKDDTPINKIAIPGTHDSGTYEMMSFARTQGTSIKDHLNMGARYFDIRVHDDGKGGVIFHGPIKKGSFPTILADIHDFVLAHPTEFLVLDFQHFSNGAETLVYKSLEEIGLLDIAVDKGDLKMSELDFIDSLTLKDVRGKVLIFFGSDLADDYSNIFRRNNDECTIDEASLDSLYQGDLHKKGSESFIENAMPHYFEHILKKNSGMLVLQGQLTSPAIGNLENMEKKHADNMTAYVLSIKDNQEYLSHVNIIMRDFFEASEDKATSILSLNYYKGIVKSDREVAYKTLCGVE